MGEKIISLSINWCVRGGVRGGERTREAVRLEPGAAEVCLGDWGMGSPL